MAHTPKPDFVFRRKGRVHLNRRRRQFSRLLAAEVCASVVVMLDTPCSEVVGRVLATHSIRQFPLHFPSRASHCAITFQTHSSTSLLHPTLCILHNLLLRATQKYFYLSIRNPPPPKPAYCALSAVALLFCGGDFQCLAVGSASFPRKMGCYSPTEDFWKWSPWQSFRPTTTLLQIMASRTGWKAAPSITAVKWWITEVLWLIEADAFDRHTHEVFMYNKSENVN